MCKSRAADDVFQRNCLARYPKRGLWADYYHPEDEVHLPWFMRLAPNTVSEPTQTSSTNVGRYTLMGDLNPFPGFREPATGCQ